MEENGMAADFLPLDQGKWMSTSQMMVAKVFRRCQLFQGKARLLDNARIQSPPHNRMSMDCDLCYIANVGGSCVMQPEIEMEPTFMNGYNTVMF